MLYLANRLKRERRARLGGSCEEGAAEEGFTLIELMVVLLIMGILMAIAIPTFLSVTGSANDKAAQSDLTNAVTNATSFYIGSQTFSKYSPSSSAITYVTSGATVNAANNIVEYEVGGGGESVAFVSWAKSGNQGTCWGVIVYKGGNGATGSSLDGNINVAGTYYESVPSPESNCTTGLIGGAGNSPGSSWAHPDAL